MFKRLLLLMLLIPFVAQAHEGGGSSTGGGHVRVCMVPQASARVKDVLVKNALVPQIAMDPFGILRSQDILSVQTLDLLEQTGSLRNDINEGLALLVKKMTPMPRMQWGLESDPRPIKVMKTALRLIYEQFKKSKSPMFNGGRRDVLSQSLMDAGDNIDWTPSQTGLRLTRDFDPKISNPANCIFGQAVRQTVSSKREAFLDYDAKLLSRMKPEDLIVLALHEAVYNTVLKAPRPVRNPSVTTRQITGSLLIALSPRYANQFTGAAAILTRLGYGPYTEDLRPTER